MELEGGNMAVAAAGDDLLQAQAHIWNHAFSFVNSMALKCAVQLGIPDAIHRHAPQPMPLSELVSVLRRDPRKTQHVYRLRRVLTHSGFFVAQKVSKNGEDGKQQQEEEGYSLTSSSCLLLKDNPTSIAHFLLSVLDSALVEPWQFLSVWFHSDDQTPFDTAHGFPFWKYMANRPKDGDFFNAGMASDSRMVGSVLLEKHRSMFDGMDSLVDVGGGTGTLATIIAEAFPEIECTVLDLPQVVANLKGNQNMKYVEGDMFEAIPPADALLSKWILHDWNDEECVKILKKCREAITSEGKKGKVVVIDIVVGDDKKDNVSTETQMFQDMVMMILVDGKERDEKEWAQLFNEAGLDRYKIFPILGLRSLIEIYV